MVANLNYSIPNTANIVRKELENGITVLVYENPAVQSVVITGSVRAGSLYESPEKNGLATITASSLMRGTTTRDFDSLHTELEDIAAELGFHAGHHRVGFNGKSLAEDLPIVLDVLSDTLRRPSFPQDQVERLRGEMLTWLQYSEQDTRYRAGKAMREALYPETHPYHYGTWGNPETLSSVTLDDIRVFHAKHYGPNGMILVVVGAVQAEDVLQVVEEKFGDWENLAQPDEPDLPPVTDLKETKRVFVHVPGKTQSDIAIGTYGPSRYDADYYPATLANSVLGQFGMMGRLGNNIREEKGLAYYAYSRVGGGHGPNAWSVIAGVNPANVELAIDSAIEELQTLANEPVSEDDLSDNQSYFTGRLPLRLESNEGIASNILVMETYNLGLNFLADYHDLIYGYSQADLQHAVKHYINPKAMVIAVAGPEYVTVKAITAEEARPLRQRIMRPDEPPEKSVYPLDDAEDTFHAGVIKNGQLIGIASVFHEAPPDQSNDKAWRLRGMATEPKVRGQGYGKLALQACMDTIYQRGGNYLWFNARPEVVGFYEKLGFVVSGEPYEVEGHGTRVFMSRDIQNGDD